MEQLNNSKSMGNSYSMGPYKIEYLFRSPQVNYLIYGEIFIAFSLLLLPNIGQSLPVQYTNYTSDKYQIEFQYPSNWTLAEKTNRFEEGSDVSITDDKIGRGDMSIGYIDDLLTYYGSTDLETAVTNLHKGLIDDYQYDYRTIESPSFSTIDNHKTGSFLVTFEKKYETDPIKGAAQWWITFVGNHAYLFNFISTPETFDSVEYTQVRDHLIKSIKFLGTNNQTG